MSHLEKVDPNDLHDGKILYSYEIEKVNNFFQTHQDKVKLSKKNKVGSGFSVLKSKNGELYALYKGKKDALGAGVCGLVKLAQNINTGEWVAVKIQRVKGEITRREHYGKKIIKENEFLRLRDQFISSQKRSKSSYFEERHYTFMPIIEGVAYNKIELDIIREFYTLLRSDLTQKEHSQKMLRMAAFLVEVALNTATELKAIHADNIIHRDLHLGNILVTIEGKVRIIDFGYALTVDSTAVVEGHALVQAPELVSARLNGKAFCYSYPQDLWALGRCLEHFKIPDLVKEERLRRIIGWSEQEVSDIVRYCTLLLDGHFHQRPLLEEVLSFLAVMKNKINEKIHIETMVNIAASMTRLSLHSLEDSFSEIEDSEDNDSSEGDDYDTPAYEISPREHRPF